MSPAVAANDLAFYVPRTDPTGPSMSDAVNSIDASALGTPGCASFVYTQRSYEPFIRDVFDQFSETKTGGAFTFMTGIGGFLQEFLYGYSGLRWRPGGPDRPQPERPAERRGAARSRLARAPLYGRRRSPNHERDADQRTGAGRRHPVGPFAAAWPLTTRSRFPPPDPTSSPAPTWSAARRWQPRWRCGASARHTAAVDSSVATDWQPVKKLRHSRCRWAVATRCAKWSSSGAASGPPRPGPMSVRRPVRSRPQGEPFCGYGLRATAGAGGRWPRRRQRATAAPTRCALRLYRRAICGSESPPRPISQRRCSRS